jgi:CTD nuclear envelope phosphatase 1
MSEYADPVIDWLDEDQTMVSHRYFRQVNGKKSEKGC